MNLNKDNILITLMQKLFQRQEYEITHAITQLSSENGVLAKIVNVGGFVYKGTIYVEEPQRRGFNRKPHLDEALHAKMDTIVARRALCNDRAFLVRGALVQGLNMCFSVGDLIALFPSPIVSMLGVNHLGNADGTIITPNQRIMYLTRTSKEFDIIKEQQLLHLITR